MRTKHLRRWLLIAMCQYCAFAIAFGLGGMVFGGKEVGIPMVLVASGAVGGIALGLGFLLTALVRHKTSCHETQRTHSKSDGGSRMRNCN